MTGLILALLAGAATGVVLGAGIGNALGVRSWRKPAEAWEKVALRWQKVAEATLQRERALIETLMAMRREGYIGPPPDESWAPYTIDDEFGTEAEAQEQVDDVIDRLVRGLDAEDP